jgi:BirA family biotin operon repressor/biotin-[acetyl-CoA-carboxylase] ligase
MFNLIKLDATTSTNDFLKSLIKEVDIENFTVVQADFQSKGKGQMGTVWASEKGKNLILSVLVRETWMDINLLFELNRLVSLSILQTLNRFEIPNISIKWPNDIMSGNKKIAGILIENIIKANDELISIVGIGLNVNQKSFTEIDHATSMCLQNHQDFEIDPVMNEILNALQHNLEILKTNPHSSYFNDLYHQNLFRKDVPTVFQNEHHEKFMGIIRGVNSKGLLVLELEHDVVKTFDIKQIKIVF